MLAVTETETELEVRCGVFGSHHAILSTPDLCPIPAFYPLVKLWFEQSQGGIPDFSQFDVLDLPPRLWSHIILLKTVGAHRRFHYELIGDAIESHNGFPGNKRFLADLPLRNKTLMAREFVRTLHHGCPIFSTGRYIGQTDYVRRVFRVIAPYRMDEGKFAFVGLVFFTARSGMETKLEDSTFIVPPFLADLPLA